MSNMKIKLAAGTTTSDKSILKKEIIKKVIYKKADAMIVGANGVLRHVPMRVLKSGMERPISWNGVPLAGPASKPASRRPF